MGQSAEIDVEIADLIEDIWRLGLHTYNSCQDNFGYVWIEFASIADAEVFLTHVAQYTEHWDTSYGRMMCRGDDELDWKYSVYPVDYGVDETPVDDIIHEHFTGQHDLRFTMSVRFPRQDLLFVKRRISNALRPDSHSCQRTSNLPSPDE